MLIVAGVAGFSGSVVADQTDPRLSPLFDQLKEAGAPAAAGPIEQQIWAIWLETSDGAVDSLMDSGIDAMSRGDHVAALDAFDQVIALSPDFAEGWNKRATVHYLLENFDESLADIAATLELEPRHFGALSGRGLVFIRLREAEQALSAFEEALDVSPRMVGPRVNVEILRRVLGQQDI